MSTTNTGTMTCQCCGGTLPSRDVWEANRGDADECTGAVTPGGRCQAFARDELWEVEVDDDTLVCGCQVQWDKSGVGHCWVDVAADDLPGQVREEIEGEIIDGGRDEGEIVASNGLHYRW